MTRFRGRANSGFKRIVDVVVAGSGLLIGAPLWLAIAAVIRLTSPGSPLHRARRVGRHGRQFTLYKFRTMTPAPDDGVGVTRRGDPRVTSVGRVLRRTKIDEVPQLVNVLKGEMSLVGPRPEDPRYVEAYTEEQRRVLVVRPGLVSLATLKYRDEEGLLADLGGDLETTYRTRVLPDKLALDLFYVEHWSLRLDLEILTRSACALLRRSRST